MAPQGGKVVDMDSIIDRYGRLCGLLSPLVFLAAAAFSILSIRGFDPFTDYLGDLGVNPHTLLVFNAGTILSGALGIAFSLFLWKSLRPGAAKSGAFLMGGALVFFSLLGVFTVQFLPIHTFLAGAFFLLALFAMLLIGVGLLSESPAAGAFSLLAALPVGLLFLAGMHPAAGHLAMASILAWFLALWNYSGRIDWHLRYEWVWM